jgi:hypothetical protein
MLPKTVTRMPVLQAEERISTRNKNPPLAAVAGDAPWPWYDDLLITRSYVLRSCAVPFQMCSRGVSYKVVVELLFSKLGSAPQLRLNSIIYMCDKQVPCTHGPGNTECPIAGPKLTI